MRRQCARAARCASASLAPRSAGPTALRPAHSPAWFAAAPPPCACGRGAGACATCGGRGVARAAAQPPRHGARCACGCAGGRLRGFATQAASPGDAGAGGAGVGPDRVEDSETATVEDLLKELGAKETELEAHAAEIEKWKDSTLRAHAEMENLRARTARASEADRKFAVQSLIKDLLDVADNLQRGLASLPAEVASAAESGSAPPQPASPEAVALHQLAVGVSMTDKALAKALRKHGAERYSPAVGDAFDANSMAALFILPAPGVEKGAVAAITKAGYKLHDRVIRPAEVGVAP